MSKILLLVVALIAAYVTSLKPGDILFLVGAAFSLAASAFFPALVLGVFWKRANKWGAITGMVAGLGLCMYYMVQTYPFFGGVAANQWFNMAPISAGVFGVPIGIITIIVVSLLTPAPSKKVQELVEHVRYPHLAATSTRRAPDPRSQPQDDKARASGPCFCARSAVSFHNRTRGLRVMLQRRIISPAGQLLGAVALAALLAAGAGCSDSGHPRGMFTGRVVDKTEEEVTADIGKPESIDKSNPERVKWIYKKKTFDPDNMNTPDAETVLVFKRDAAGKLKVSEVSVQLMGMEQWRHFYRARFFLLVNRPARAIEGLQRRARRRIRPSRRAASQPRLRLRPAGQGRSCALQSFRRALRIEPDERRDALRPRVRP